MKRSAALAACLAAVLLVASAGFAQRGAVSVQQAMDKPISLSVTDSTVGEVFKRLTDLTGVRFILGDETLEYLPYGDQTRLAMKLDNITLRKALTPMLAPQGLQWILEDDAVRVFPSEPLYRIGRRATYEELKLLVSLQSGLLQPVDKGGDVLAQFRKLSGEKEPAKLVFHAAGDRTAALQRAEKVLPGTGEQWLDALCQGQSWTWYVSGNEVVIVERLQQVNRQLQKRVSLNYQGAKLLDILTDLAHKGRLQLEMDPGVLGMLPPDVQNSFNLIMSDATIAQALQMISGVSGLKFTPIADGIRVDASDTLAARNAPTSQPKKRPPFFVKMAMPSVNGTAIEVYWTPEELPDDVLDAIQAQKPEVMKQLRESIKKNTPASMPAGVVVPASSVPATVTTPATPAPAPTATRPAI